MLHPIMLMPVYLHRHMLLDLLPSDAEVYFSGETDRLISLWAGNQPVAPAAAAVRQLCCLLCRPLSFLLSRLIDRLLLITDIILPQLA